MRGAVLVTSSPSTSTASADSIVRISGITAGALLLQAQCEVDQRLLGVAETRGKIVGPHQQCAAG